MIWLGAIVLVSGLVVVVGVVSGEVAHRRRLRAFFAGQMGSTPRQPLARWLEAVRVEPAAVIAVGIGLTAAIIAAAVTGSLVLAALVVAGSIGGAALIRRHTARREALVLRSQLADAMTSVASSMTAGSTFVQSLQQLTADSSPPLRPHLEYALDEIAIGVTASEAFEGLARRTGLPPARWLAHVLKLQETSGTPLVPLLQRLASHVHQEDELGREIQALTAEGRMSAYVIAGLPAGLVLLLELVQPGYLDRFLSGAWLVVAVAMAGSIGVGLAVISRMIRSLEV